MTKSQSSAIIIIKNKSTLNDKTKKKKKWDMEGEPQDMGNEKQEMKNLNIDVEPYGLKLEPLYIMDILNQPVDATLDLYNDYRTLYNITKDDKFLVRSHNILNLLKRKLREESKTK